LGLLPANWGLKSESANLTLTKDRVTFWHFTVKRNQDQIQMPNRAGGLHRHRSIQRRLALRLFLTVVVLDAGRTEDERRAFQPLRVK
jgi:hypothetical protein